MKLISGITFAAALALSACNTQNGNSAAQQQGPGTQSGIDKSLMDTSVQPGDDFDKYANGKWEASAQIPADKSTISVFSVIADRGLLQGLYEYRSYRTARPRPHQGGCRCH